MCPQQMLHAQANGETVVSATMCPQQCVLVCQDLKSLKHYPNLRCTIDCSEIFIDLPRSEILKFKLGSEYKKHNTVKFLVGIAPGGMINFLLKPWGGGASDQHITRGCGLVNLLEPTDLTMAAGLYLQ